MVLLSASEIAKHYGDKEILRSTSLEIRSGDHIALVGPNGIGKTTLLKILTGQLQPDGGRVEMPSRGSIGYLEQHPEFAAEDTVWSLASAAIGSLSGLADESEQVAAQLAVASDDSERQQLMEQFDLAPIQSIFGRDNLRAAQ